jgi:hypothetical protein
MFKNGDIIKFSDEDCGFINEIYLEKIYINYYTSMFKVNSGSIPFDHSILKTITLITDIFRKEDV